MRQRVRSQIDHPSFRRTTGIGDDESVRSSLDRRQRSTSASRRHGTKLRPSRRAHRHGRVSARASFDVALGDRDGVIMRDSKDRPVSDGHGGSSRSHTGRNRPRLKHRRVCILRVSHVDPPQSRSANVIVRLGSNCARHLCATRHGLTSTFAVHRQSLEPQPQNDPPRRSQVGSQSTRGIARRELSTRDASR